jgi:hypothetical protein
MSSKLRNKLMGALELENEIYKSVIKETVNALCSKENCYEIIKQNKIRGEILTNELKNTQKNQIKINL